GLFFFHFGAWPGLLCPANQRDQPSLTRARKRSSRGVCKTPRMLRNCDCTSPSNFLGSGRRNSACVNHKSWCRPAVESVPPVNCLARSCTSEGSADSSFHWPAGILLSSVLSLVPNCLLILQVM